MKRIENDVEWTDELPLNTHVPTASVVLRGGILYQKWTRFGPIYGKEDNLTVWVKVPDIGKFIDE